MVKYSAEFKHNVLRLYKPNTRGSGFKALAARFDIKGGGIEILRWWKRWNGKKTSLERREGSGRPQVLTSAEKKKHMLRFVEANNKKSQPVNYHHVRQRVVEKTGKQLSLRRVRSIGKSELGLRWKKTTRSLYSQGEPFRLHNSTARHICIPRDSGKIPQKVRSSREEKACVYRRDWDEG